MAVAAEFLPDVAAILAKRHGNGADHWTTPDHRLTTGGPFSTLGAVRLLAELGVEATDPDLAAATDLIWSSWREDGRFRLAPGAIYPCQTAHAASTLARLGQAGDPRLTRTFEHLLEIQFSDGGWRCNKFSFGRGPETRFSNPGPTLLALDAFRFIGLANESAALERAVGFLLDHWVSRAPLGPCHYGIGSLFLQVGYPFADYNLFYWVHVLSSYRRARTDPRFAEALAVLEAGLVEGQVVPQRVSRGLAGLEFCRRGVPSRLATVRYQEILGNLADRSPQNPGGFAGRRG